jgi:DNA-binding NtrC family response regulator
MIREEAIHLGHGARQGPTRPQVRLRTTAIDQTDSEQGLLQIEPQARTKMESVKKIALRISSSSSPVLIRGTAGTDTEPIALLIHRRSARTGNVFRSVNCAVPGGPLLSIEHTIAIDVPPLRERRHDIPELLAHFLKKHSQENPLGERRLTLKANDLLLKYGWPGDVRELESVIERSILLSESGEIAVEALPIEVREYCQPTSQRLFKLPLMGINLQDVERDLIMQAMEQTEYNITRAAKLLGLTFRTLQYRLEKFGIKGPKG